MGMLMDQGYKCARRKEDYQYGIGIRRHRENLKKINLKLSMREDY